ncbi:MAG: cytochrome c biogenesis CcdA family protein [bacterium]
MVKPTLIAAFMAGILSFVSPCVLPMVPGYLAFISGMSVERLKKGELEQKEKFRLFGNALLFILGFSIVFVIIGLAASGAGDFLKTARLAFLRDLEGHLSVRFTTIMNYVLEEQYGYKEVFKIGVQQVLGVIVAVFALDRLGLFKIPFLAMQSQTNVIKKPASIIGTVLVGSAFAISWSPCVGPILGAILSVAATEENLREGLVLLAIYSAGLAVPFLLAAGGMGYFFKFLRKAPRLYKGFEITTGILLLGISYLLITDKMTTLNQYFQGMNKFVNTSPIEERIIGGKK